jgi:excisionase family DNA binding protein
MILMANNTYYDTFENYPEVLNAKMIAEILGFGYVKTLRFIKYGGIKHVKIGNTYRVPKKKFLEWLYSDDSKEIKLDEE